MRRLFYSIIIFSLFLASCTMPEVEKRNVYFVSVALDYREHVCTNDDNKVVLNATTHDQYGMIRELLALDDSLNAKLFLGSNGERYVLSTDEGSTSPSTAKTKTALDVLPYKIEAWNSESVLASIDAIAQKAKPDDLFIFQYSGHGDMNAGELVLAIEDNGSVHKVTDFISSNMLLSHVEQLKCPSILIVDSCYSGNFVKYNTLGSGNLFQGIKSRTTFERLKQISLIQAATESFSIITNENEKKLPDIYVFAAATSKQTSLDNDKDIWPADTPLEDRFGGFTYYILKSMGYDPINDEPHNTGKTITLYSLFNDTWKAMRKGHRAYATPTITLSPLDIVLFN